VLDLRQKSAGHVVIQAPRHGHSREHAVHEKFYALLVQLIRDVAELRDSLGVCLSDYCSTILSKPFLDLLTLFWKVFVQGRRVIPVPVLERL
jgi:hypothetical protein